VRQELREIHAAWLQRREDEGRREVAETEKEDGAEVPAELDTPVAFAPQDLPIAAIDINVSSSILQGVASPSILDAVESSPETSVEVLAGAPSSPTFSISTISDLTPTELGEDIGEGSSERMITRHETFYFEDGNVEIMSGGTIFRVHSTVVSFSSPKLRDILSRSALLHASTPEGCPRITATDNAIDFAVLLKMIYTPGRVSRSLCWLYRLTCWLVSRFPAKHGVLEFTVFASLLRMTTKYGFSDVRDQLIKDVKGAYPTRWEAYQVAEILGEDVFGSPKPHPKAVLNLFGEQKVRFALPFAGYRASLGDFSTLMNDKPGTILP
jgi:hypothetical protein